jgi:hypothetical protein
MGPDQDVWRKSSYSGGDSNCVELRNDLTAIRDTKNPTGPTLTGDVTTLLTAIKDDRIG